MIILSIAFVITQKFELELYELTSLATIFKMWIALTLLASFIWVVCNYIDKHITERCLPDMPRYYAFSALSSALLALGVVLWVGFWLPAWPYVLLLVVSGGGFAGMIYFYLKALKTEEASYVVPLFQLSPVWAAVQAYFFLGESLTGWDLVAFIIIFVGGLVLAVRKFSKDLLQLRPAFGLMVLATLFVSVMFVSFKYVYNLYPEHFWELYALQLWGQFVFGAVLVWAGWSKTLSQCFLADLKQFFPLFLFNDFLSFLAFAAYLVALTLAPVALVGAVGGVQAFFAFVLGAILTRTHSHLVKEDLSWPVVWQKLLGISILLGGVALLQLA